MPLYELFDVALGSHLTWDGFMDLEYWERVRLVAWTRLKNLIEQHQHARALSAVP